MNRHQRHLAATRPAHNKHTFQQQIIRQRDLENTTRDLVQFHDRNQMMLANAQSDARVETKRHQRRQQQQNQELATAHMLESQARAQEERRLLASQDRELAMALQEHKSKKIADEVHARRVLEGSDELRELKARLQAAHMNKMRSTQVVERQLLSQDEATRQAQMDAQYESDRLRALEYAQRDAESAHAVKLATQADLRAQMSERERDKQAAYIENLRERAMVDEVVRGIEADDALKAANHRAKQEEMQANIADYLNERRAWREKEVEREEAELAKINDYQRMQAARNEELRVQKQAVQDEHVAMIDAVRRDVTRHQREQEERENMLHDLYHEEAEAKALAKERERAARKQQLKDEMLSANAFLKRLKAERMRQQDEEEKRFRDEMMAKFAEDKRLEAMNAARRRREMVAYKAEVDRLVDEKRAIYEKELMAELDARRAEAAQADADQAIVERERQRLLREYATELGDFLPKGIFRNPADFKQVMNREPESYRAPEDSYGINYSQMFARDE